MDYSSWYNENSHQLTGQGLWLRGGEWNTVPAFQWGKWDFRLMFVRLSTYFDTLHSFSHQLLYQYASSLEGVFPDLAYLPPRSDGEFLTRAKIPWLLGSQSKRGARDFDLIGFSNSIVQELFNIPTLMLRSDIPLKKSERMKYQDIPLLLLGGSNALYTSSIWEEDPMVDGIFVGESDRAIREIICICRDGKKAGKTKKEVLVELSRVEGFLEPDRPKFTRKASVSCLEESEALVHGPVFYGEDELGKAHLPISEGCPCFCSFCAESWDRKPYRERSRKNLRDIALEMKASMGLDTVELYSFNFNMHGEFYQLLEELLPMFRRIELKSQRFDLLSEDPSMIEVQHVVGKSSVTCGLEGVSERTRRYLHKNLREIQIKKSFEVMFKVQTRELKIFLIATGLEEEQDFDEFEGLLTWIEERKKQLGIHTRVIFSITPLVRFPWTPLEFDASPSLSSYRKILEQIRDQVRDHDFEFRESSSLSEYWVSQVLLRADDSRVAEAVRQSSRSFVYYREMGRDFHRQFEERMKKLNIEYEKYFMGMSFEQSESKPWVFIDTGVKRQFLWEEYQRSRDYKEKGYCLGGRMEDAQCLKCGACSSKEQVNELLKPKKMEKKPEVSVFKKLVREGSREEKEISFLVEVGEKARAVPRKAVGVVLAGSLMQSDSDLISSYRGFRGSYWGGEEGLCFVTGAEIIRLAFREGDLPHLKKFIEDERCLSALNQKIDGWARVIKIHEGEWVPKILRVSQASKESLANYLLAQGLKYILRKKEGGKKVFELTSQAQKKGIVRGVTIEETPLEVVLELGPKFSLEKFFRLGLGLEKNSKMPLLRSI